MTALAALVALLAAAPSGEAPPVSMSLPEALAELDRQNPSLEEARGRAAAALGVVRQAAAPLLPNLSAGGGYFHNNTSVIITAPSGGALERIYLQPLDAWYGSAGLRVPLIVPEAWFSVAAARDSALAAAEAADATRLAVRSALIQAAWTAFATTGNPTVPGEPAHAPREVQR